MVDEKAAGFIDDGAKSVTESSPGAAAALRQLLLGRRAIPRRDSRRSRSGFLNGPGQPESCVVAQLPPAGAWRCPANQAFSGGTASGPSAATPC